MDQIIQFPQKIELTSLLHTKQLFLQVCKNESLFTLLFDYIDKQAYFQLLLTNSTVNQILQKHETVQIKILRYKVNLLKLREFRRNLSMHLWVDFNMFNPFALPPYQDSCQDSSNMNDGQHRQFIQQQNKQRQRLYLQAKKLGDHDYQVIKQVQWTKWRDSKKNQQTSKKQLKSNKKNQQKLSNKINDKVHQNTNDLQNKQETIKKAEMYRRNTLQLKRKLIQEYPKTQDEFEAIRNKHFFQKFINKNDLKNYYQNKRIMSNQQENTDKIINTNATGDQFYDACSQQVKKQIANKLWITKMKNPKNEEFVPNPRTIASKLSNNVQKIFKKLNVFRNTKVDHLPI